MITAKEFEEMFGNTSFGTMIMIRDWVNEHYVSKDKIKEIIKELEESIGTYNEGDFYNTDYITRLKAQIIILKSLLLEEGEPDAK